MGLGRHADPDRPDAVGTDLDDEGEPQPREVKKLLERIPFHFRVVDLEFGTFRRPRTMNQRENRANQLRSLHFLGAEFLDLTGREYHARLSDLAGEAWRVRSAAWFPHCAA
jgi:hypothetical protein